MNLDERQKSSQVEIERLYESEGVFSSSAREEQVEYPRTSDWNHIR